MSMSARAIKNISGISTFIAGVLTLSSPVNAIALIGNFPPGDPGTDDPAKNTNIQNSSGSQKAVGFTPKAAYILTNIEFRVGNRAPADTTEVLIFSGNPSSFTSPGLNPTAVFKDFMYSTGGGNAIVSETLTATPITPFTFVANTRYFILLDSPGNTFSWRTNTLDAAPTGFGGTTFDGYQLSTNNGTSYTPSTINNTFVVNAEPVPYEFETAAGLVAFGGFFMLRKSLKKRFNKV